MSHPSACKAGLCHKTNVSFPTGPPSVQCSTLTPLHSCKLGSPAARCAHAGARAAAHQGRARTAPHLWPWCMAAQVGLLGAAQGCDAPLLVATVHSTLHICCCWDAHHCCLGGVSYCLFIPPPPLLSIPDSESCVWVQPPSAPGSPLVRSATFSFRSNVFGYRHLQLGPSGCRLARFGLACGLCDESGMHLHCGARPLPLPSCHTALPAASSPAAPNICKVRITITRTPNAASTTSGPVTAQFIAEGYAEGVYLNEMYTTSGCILRVRPAALPLGAEAGAAVAGGQARVLRCRHRDCCCRFTAAARCRHCRCLMPASAGLPHALHAAGQTDGVCIRLLPHGTHRDAPASPHHLDHGEWAGQRVFGLGEGVPFSGCGPAGRLAAVPAHLLRG